MPGIFPHIIKLCRIRRCHDRIRTAGCRVFSLISSNYAIRRKIFVDNFFCVNIKYSGERTEILKKKTIQRVLIPRGGPQGISVLTPHNALIHSGFSDTFPARALSISASVASLSPGILAFMGR